MQLSATQHRNGKWIVVDETGDTPRAFRWEHSSHILFPIWYATQAGAEKAIAKVAAHAADIRAASMIWSRA
jgi:hypothetical protein